MKRSWLAAAVICGAGAVLYLMLGAAPRVEPSGKPGAGAINGAVILAERPAPPAEPNAPTGAAALFPADHSAPVESKAAAPAKAGAELPPATVVEHVRRVVTQYNSMLGENPVGTNLEITRALLGKNPKRINFLGDESDHINAQGEWVDPWGTPYFFHQLSARQMEVRSAGPDRIMWTADDLVAR
jgi:hypothetical protein